MTSEAVKVYTGCFECDTCGWVDDDESFFYKMGERIACSLHKANA